MSDARFRILIVDDSSFMRMALRKTLESDPAFEVVGVASDGKDGIDKAIALRPDLVTMDVEMPGMNGIAALRQIMAKAPTRVIMVSSLTSQGALSTFDALEAGAVDYVTKDTSDGHDSIDQFHDILLKRARAALGSKHQFFRPQTASTPAAPPTPQPVASMAAPAPHRAAKASAVSLRKVACVGIGASTGGPIAVQNVISKLPGDYPHPIVIAIHMPKAFTASYAERLNQRSQIEVREAVDREMVRPGLALLAPGGHHLTLAKVGGGLQVRLHPAGELPQYIFVPSIDQMLHSMAEASAGACLGIVLTGMGSDGCKGMKHIKELGGVSIVQNEATSTIYGMPKACVDAGVADLILPIEEIGPEISKVRK